MCHHVRQVVFLIKNDILSTFGCSTLPSNQRLRCPEEGERIESKLHLYTFYEFSKVRIYYFRALLKNIAVRLYCTLLLVGNVFFALEDLSVRRSLAHIGVVALAFAWDLWAMVRCKLLLYSLISMINFFSFTMIVFDWVVLVSWRSGLLLILISVKSIYFYVCWVLVCNNDIWYEHI